MVRRDVAVLMAVLLAVACDASDPESSAFTVRDSASIRIVENQTPVWGVGESWHVTDEPLVEIGEVEGEQPYQFSSVSSALRLLDGRIVVADRETRDVRYFDQDGRHLGTVGGPGDGPEEYRQGPRQLLALRADTLLVQDGWDRVWYDAEGSFVTRQSTSTNEFRELAGVNAQRTYVLWLARDYLLSVFVERRSSPIPTGTTFRSRRYFALTPGTPPTASDVVFEPLGSRQQMVDVDVYPVPMPFVTAFTPESHAVSAPDGRTLLLADGEIPEVRKLHLDGHQEMIRWRPKLDPITDQDLRAWAERYVRGRSEADQVWLRRGLAELEIPEARPPIGHLIAGRDGSIWVGSERPTSPIVPPVRWAVFDRSGRWLGEVDMPDRFVPLDIGDDYVLGDWRDEFDVPFVRMYGLIKP